MALDLRRRAIGRRGTAAGDRGPWPRRPPRAPPARARIDPAVSCGRRRTPSTSAGYVDGLAGRAPLGQDAVERRGIALADRRAVDVELQQVRSQQRDRGLARAAGARERQHEIEQRRIRLRAERQRVERLIRHARVGEHLLREIEIRQRALKHDRGRTRTRGAVAARSRAGCHARRRAAPPRDRG